jgi:hypothetical protein
MKNPRLLSRKFDIYNFKVRIDGHLSMTFFPLRHHLSISDLSIFHTLSLEKSILGKEFKNFTLHQVKSSLRMLFTITGNMKRTITPITAREVRNRPRFNRLGR